MPKLRVETIDSHRRAVHGAILDTTAALAAAPGEGRARASQEGNGLGHDSLHGGQQHP